MDSSVTLRRITHFIDLPEKSAAPNLHNHISYHSRIGNPYGDRDYADSLRVGLANQGLSKLLARIYTPGEYIRIEKQLKQRGIFTVSETDKSILMWSHYGEEHKGICIGIEVDTENIPNEMILKKVEYIGDSRPVIDKDILTSDLDLNLHLLSSKHKDWQYEKEWRFILKDNLDEAEPGRAVEVPGKIVSVSIGLRTENSYVEKVKSCLKGADISYMGHTYFGFTLEKFHTR